MITKHVFTSVSVFFIGLVTIGALTYFLLFEMLGMDYDNPFYMLSGALIGSIYFEWFKDKQKKLHVFDEE